MRAGCPPSCSHSFSQAGPEECKLQKLLDEDKEITSELLLQAKQGWLGQRYFIIYSIRVRNKGKSCTISCHTSLFSSQAQPYSFIPAAVQGGANCGSKPIAAPSTFSLLHYGFPRKVQSFKNCSSVDPCPSPGYRQTCSCGVVSPWVKASFRTCLPAPVWGFSMGCRGTACITMLFCRVLQGSICSGVWSTSSHSFTGWGASFLLFCSPLLCPSGTLPFLRWVSLRHHCCCAHGAWPHLVWVPWTVRVCAALAFPHRGCPTASASPHTPWGCWMSQTTVKLR